MNEHLQKRINATGPKKILACNGVRNHRVGSTAHFCGTASKFCKA